MKIIKHPSKTEKEELIDLIRKHCSDSDIDKNINIHYQYFSSTSQWANKNNLLITLSSSNNSIARINKNKILVYTGDKDDRLISGSRNEFKKDLVEELDLIFW